MVEPDARLRERLVRKLSTIAGLSEGEKQVLRDLPISVRTFEAGQDVVREGDRPSVCGLLLEGFAHRYKVLPTGRRQILSFHIPGDMPDLMSLFLHVMDHGLAATARTSVAFITHAAMRATLRAHPAIAEAMWRETLVDAASQRGAMTALGRLSATARVAQLLCEMGLRFEAAGVAARDAFELPVTQIELGDALGLSSVHVNRVLQALRRDGMIEWQGRAVRMLDRAGLERLCDFDPTYLHLSPDR